MGKDLQQKFEKYVIDYLKVDKMANLWWMHPFYEGCCDTLGLDFNNIHKNQAKIRAKLLKMKKKGLIDSRRTGSGFLGKTDFGSTSSNVYTLPNFWLT